MTICFVVLVFFFNTDVLRFATQKELADLSCLCFASFCDGISFSM